MGRDFSKAESQDVVTGWVQGGEGETGVEIIPRVSPGHNVGKAWG